MVLKFTRNGKSCCRSASRPDDQTARTRLNSDGPPTWSSIRDQELYVADGYFNHRVIVFDAPTARSSGCGAPTAAPTDEKAHLRSEGAARQQFNNPVHGVRLTKDGLVSSRIAEQPRPGVPQDGTFVREYAV